MSKKRCKSFLSVDSSDFACDLNRKHEGQHEFTFHSTVTKFCWRVTWWKPTDPADWKVAKE